MSEAPLFLDVNVPMYAAGRSHRYKESCAWILNEVAAERLSVAIDTEVVQEILYRYGALQEWDVAVMMAGSLLDLVPLVLPVTADDMQIAVQLFDRYARQGVKARDMIHAAVMAGNGITKIISTDKHFDRFPDVIRLDPQDLFAAANGYKG